MGDTDRMGEKPRVIIAIRVSSREQRDEGFGYAAQVRRLPEIVDEQGWAIAHRPDGSPAIYDEGFASTTPEDMAKTSLEHRPVMTALLAELVHTQPTYLLCRELDRLRRDVYEHALIMKLLRAAGVTAVVEAPSHTAVRILDLADPQMMLTTDVSAAVSGYFKADQKIKLMMGRHERARQGKPNGGRIPYGYKRPKRREAFQINDDEAETYRLMVSLVVEHQWGPAKIAHELVKRGKINRSGKPEWTATTVRRILRSKAQCGFMRARFGGEDNWLPAVGQPPIIEENEWSRMTAILDARTTESGHNQRSHALAGLLRCAACGKTLKAQVDGRRTKEGKRYFNYSCKVYNSGCKAGFSISEAKALRELGLWVDAQLAATDEAGWRSDLSTGAPDISILEERLAALTKEAERAKAAQARAWAGFVDAEPEDKEIARQEHNLRRSRVEEAEAAQTAAEQAYASAMTASSVDVLELDQLRSILEEWRDFPDNEKRMALSAVIDHAVLGPRTQSPRLRVVPRMGMSAAALRLS